nr:Toll/interleukin-1 receptor (TIR) domain-containing protein [Tanacetum cinerariifolium]
MSSVSLVVSSSYTSSPSRSFKYDVFISFSGEDSRTSFIVHLYAALQQHGIHTFKDDERLQKGKRINDKFLASIEDSRFYIIVFSKNYASSSWCLNKLVKIIECWKMNEHTAYPVIYDVDPSKVRKQSGAVGEAFDKHTRIKGMGGAGKTTLARAIFDTLSIKFEAKIFVDNVREVSKAIVHVEKNMMKKKLGGKILLVLDDVDHIDQLKALVEMMENNKADADKQFAEILQMLKTRQPAATVTVTATTIPPPPERDRSGLYITMFEKKAAQLPGLQEDVLEGIFIKGLKHELRTAVRTQKPTGLSQAIDLALIIDETCKGVLLVYEEEEEEEKEEGGDEEHVHLDMVEVSAQSVVGTRKIEVILGNGNSKKKCGDVSRGAIAVIGASCHR